jgi:hypothetical protein
MTSELKPDQYFEEYVSGGPKNYAYVTVGPVAGCRKTVCKFRGMAFIYAVSQLVNFDLIKEMDLNAGETATVNVNTNKKIKRERYGGGFHMLK